MRSVGLGVGRRGTRSMAQGNHRARLEWVRMSVGGKGCGNELGVEEGVFRHDMTVAYSS
jgi:hypothetical protein